MLNRKTKQMLRVEAEQGERLEDLLPRLIDERGQSGAADYLDVSKATVGYWLLKLGISIARVAVAPGDTLTIIKKGKHFDICNHYHDERIN